VAFTLPLDGAFLGHTARVESPQSEYLVG
jgi:hypothetical protein